MGPLVSFALLVVGLYGSYHSWSLGLWGEGEPGVGLFPFLFSALLALFMVIHLSATRLVLPDRGTWAALRSHRRLLAYLTGLGLYVVSFASLGFVVSSTLGFVVIMRVGEGLGWKKIILVTGVSLAVTLVILQRLLGVPLPAGVFA